MQGAFILQRWKGHAFKGKILFYADSAYNPQFSTQSIKWVVTMSQT